MLIPNLVIKRFRTDQERALGIDFKQTMIYNSINWGTLVAYNKQNDISTVTIPRPPVVFMIDLLSLCKAALFFIFAFVV